MRETVTEHLQAILSFLSSERDADLCRLSLLAYVFFDQVSSGTVTDIIIDLSACLLDQQ